MVTHNFAGHSEQRSSGAQAIQSHAHSQREKVKWQSMARVGPLSDCLHLDGEFGIGCDEVELLEKFRGVGTKRESTDISGGARKAAGALELLSHSACGCQGSGLLRQEVKGSLTLEIRPANKLSGSTTRCGL